MLQDDIHKVLVEKCDEVCAWFEKQTEGVVFPIYSSFDIRDSGWKIAPVDANLFPAGFNNICSIDKESAPDILKKYLATHYPNLRGRIALLTEEHTGNPYYWENVNSLQRIIEQAYSQPLICVPRDLSAPVNVKSSNGHEITIYGAQNTVEGTVVNGQKIELIVCNNDFSEQYIEWSRNLSTAINPPNELGWYNRRKHSFFDEYNKLATGFAELIGINAQQLRVETELFKNFDINDNDSIGILADKVDEFLLRIQDQYKTFGIHDSPFCFIKNNSGTYGLAVTQVNSGDEIRKWNSKDRKKMKAAKGGREVSEIIIQEGILTRYKDESGGAAEPCIYLIGGELVGGFLRTHSKKGPEESLNSPGAVYKRLCMSDLETDLKGCPMENVYGWTSRLAALATAREARAANIKIVTNI